MKKTNELEINYKAYIYLLIRQKFPALFLGLCLIIGVGVFILQTFIISKFPNKTKQKVTEKVVQKKYLVKEGEDLWQIAEKNYGSGYNAYDIAQANNLKEPYIVNAGQVLIIPSVAKRFPTQGDITEPAPATKQVTLKGSTYTVQEEDYLFQIAEKAYGDGNLMQKIIDANKIPPPYNIETGQKLQIPR